MTLLAASVSEWKLSHWEEQWHRRQITPIYQTHKTKAKLTRTVGWHRWAKPGGTCDPCCCLDGWRVWACWRWGRAAWGWRRPPRWRWWPWRRGTWSATPWILAGCKWRCSAPGRWPPGWRWKHSQRRLEGQGKDRNGGGVDGCDRRCSDKNDWTEGKRTKGRAELGHWSEQCTLPSISPTGRILRSCTTTITKQTNKQKNSHKIETKEKQNTSDVQWHLEGSQPDLTQMLR